MRLGIVQIDADPDALQSLIGMGFNPQSAARALQQCQNVQVKAINALVSWGQSARASTVAAGFASTTDTSSNTADSTGPTRADLDDFGQSAKAASLLAQALLSSKSE